MKHFLSWILAPALLLGLVPMGVSAVEETGQDAIRAIVEQMIRSYAASLSQNTKTDPPQEVRFYVLQFSGNSSSQQ